ncbi:Twinkle protein, mitochondrial [Frankliniella fusca]|uniref:Twinkle protein, mitochondrial n=1 Tax=Frankliniella fusca TaxID=407009 RepID=A0AAE1LUH6_9NEOP|nr:Twinkle protein, mitochondrial [Frankliniella fusca]
MDLRFQHPCTALVVGGTGSGKTFFMNRLIENRNEMFNTTIDHIIFYYSEWQPLYDTLKSNHWVDFREELPLLDDHLAGQGPKLIVIDDMMHEIKCHHKEILKFFIKGSHHRNLSIFFLNQCLFPDGLRQISLNTHYIVLFKTSRDLAQIRTFCMQVDPQHFRALLEAYEDATRAGRIYSGLYSTRKVLKGDDDRTLNHLLTMAPAAKTHKAVLQVLQSAKPKLRKAILDNSDRALIYAICEICDNLLRGNIPISESHKKMILVPHESVARLHDPTPSTTETQLSALDNEMELIMRKKYADDSLKWKLYNEALQRYLHFNNERKKPVRISVEDFSLDDTGDTALIRQQLAAAIPKTYKAAALRLHDYLSTTGSRVTWDSSGLVSLEGTPVTNSNIIDLISDLTRSRKNFEPVGVSNFIKTLYTLNIPLELIPNEKRRVAIIQARNQDGGGTVVPITKPKRVRNRVTKIKRLTKPKHAWHSWGRVSRAR